MYDRAAQRLLAQHREIARDSIYTAVVCGDLEEVARILRENPEEAGRRGGSRAWTPLLYLCYTRFSHAPSIQNAAAIAQLLLDHGANPNDYYMAGDALYSALVGVAGEGEQDSPRQPNAEVLFQLLLDRGAEPFDIQVLYNTHFSGNMIWWLDLVYAHTAKTRQDAWKEPTWSMLGMGGYGPGAYFILKVAVDRNNLDLAEWALARGASPEIASSTHPKFKPRHTLYPEAVLRGRTEMARLLLRYGAQPVEPLLDDEEAFVAACLQFDRERIRAAVTAHPGYLRSTKAVFAAAAEDRDEVVAFLLDLGTPVDLENHQKQRILHTAAGHNALRVARLLLERGAEIDPRDAQWDGTPIGWAAYGTKVEMVEFLSRYSRNVWTLTFRGYVARLREVLREEPDLARAVTSDGITPLWWLPDDESKALESVQLLLAAGADPSIKSKEGKTAADWAFERGMLEVARRLTAG